MALKLSNNADGLLALAISDSDTSLTLRAGHGSRFPALGSGDWFPITVVRASDPSQFEIMRCTARSGDTLTVVRAQEGTSAITFDAGDVVSLRLTSGTLEENFPQVEGRNAKNLRFSIDSVGGKPELKFKSGNNEETVVRRSDLTTSPTDTTPGRVLTVGAFGLGGYNDLRNKVYTTGAPKDLYGKGYVIGFTDGSQLSPPIGTSNNYGTLEVKFQWNDSSGLRGCSRTFTTEDKVFVQRAVDDDTWGPWRRFAFADEIGELKGKRMLFLEATAPPGWTQDTSINDRVLRIVNSAGGGLGGSWTISGLSASVSVGATTLSVSQMPSHSHTVSFQTVNMTQGTVAVHPTLRQQGSNIDVSTKATGGGGSHTHSASASISSNGSWRPAYVDVIACTKD